MSWSREQQEAIDSRDCNLLVSAAAGAGKTSVLVERIIQRLLKDCPSLDITQLLVVTFTNAAAAEMRERIGQALSKEREAGSGQHVERQLALLPSASISTFHSFCQSVIRQYFYLLDLDPSFRLAGKNETDLLRQDVMNALFEERHAEENHDFLYLLECYGGERDNKNLTGLLYKLYDFSRSHPWSQKWLDGLAEAFVISPDRSLDELPWTGMICEQLALSLEEIAAGYTSLLATVHQPGHPESYAECLIEEQAAFSQAAAAARTGWLPLSYALESIEFRTLPRSKAAEEVKALYQNLRKDAKGLRKKWQTAYFSRQPQELLQELRELEPLVRGLTELAAAFHQRYQQAKREKGILDFSDLEHFCLDILRDSSSVPENPVPSAAALEIGKRYREIMVDEYQDTNGVQESILRLVAQNCKLFQVGDVKQSIYRFRLADPGLFLEKYRSYPLEKGRSNRRIDLSANFRSHPNILAAVNFLFQQVMTERAAEMDYKEAECLQAGTSYPQHESSLTEPVEVHLLDTQGAGNPATDSEEVKAAEELSRFEQEALFIAQRMQELRTGNYQVYDKRAGWRPLQWRDMVVLLRSVQGKAAILLDALRQQGIPAYADEDAGYFEAVEVQIMRALLEIIDNPCQDIALAAVLRSPLGNFQEEELTQMHLASEKKGLWEALRFCAQTATGGELTNKAWDFVGRLRRWRTFSRRRGVAELIWHLYQETGYYEYVGGMTGGAVRQANLRALYDRACQYEDTHFRGLFRFLQFLRRLTGDGGDMAVGRALGEGEDVVRVMSIHKSKGLEFPVVFVGDLGKKFNLRDTQETILLHKEWGIGPYCIWPSKRYAYPSLAWHGLHHCLVKDNKAEELRVLYVAFTRAREKLILVGSSGKMVKDCQRWGRVLQERATALPDGLLTGASGPLDWLAPALMRHPDGQELRLYGGWEQEAAVKLPESEACHWQVCIHQGTAISKIQPEVMATHPWKETLRTLQPVPAEPVPTWMEQNLSWQYPAQTAVGKPAKVSVSDLKRRFAEDNGEHPPAESLFQVKGAFLRPRFIQKEGRSFTAAEKGTYMHTALQHLNLQGDLRQEGIVLQLQQMIDKEYLLPTEAAAVDTAVIARFLASPLGERLLSARWVRREVPFTCLLPAERLYTELSGQDERIFLQGIVDCLFEDVQGKLVLLDYKTDAQTDPQILRSRYQIQLEVYAQALQAVLGREIDECCLFALRSGQAVWIQRNKDNWFKEKTK